MKLPKELTTVTRVSKVVALTMFFFLPIIGFMFGMNYRTFMDNARSLDLFPQPKNAYACELDVNVCPDNRLVGRYPPSCNFAPCEVKNEGSQGTLSPTATPMPTRAETSFTCPKDKWVDCMPGPGKGKKKECGSDYLKWARQNCPGFEGAAL